MLDPLEKLFIMADGHAKVSSIDIPNTKFNVGNVNLDDIRTYKNNKSTLLSMMGNV